MEVEVEPELEDAEEAEELEHGLPVAAPVDMRTLFIMRS